MSALLSSFSRLLAARPHRPLIYRPAGTPLTAADIWTARGAHADALRAAGLRSGDLLVSAAGNRPSCVSLLLAAREMDIALLPVDAGTTPTELSDLCERFGAAAAVVPVEQASTIGRMAASLSDGLVLIDRCARGRRDEYSSVALLKLTSGSTGLPKASRCAERVLVADSTQIVQGMRIGPDDTQIAVIPMSHAYGISVILVPLVLQGTPMVLRDSFVPHQLPADAAATRARTFPGVPFMFDYFLANPPPGGWPAGLQKLISAGAPLPASTVRGYLDRFAVKIHSFYGASEAGGISYDDSDDDSGLGTVGRPLPGVELTFQPDDDSATSARRVHVRSAGVADGYAGDEQGDFRDGGFLTGDYGELNAGGRLVLTGRASSFINVAGKKVQPAEIEGVLAAMPGIREARVIAAADRQRGEQVVACLIADPGASPPSTLAVRRFCSARLAPFKIPRAVLFLEAMPLTARGKLDRRALDDAVRAAIAGSPEQLC